MQITVAAVMPLDIYRIRQFFEELESLLDDEPESWFDECTVGEWLVSNYCRIRYDWERLICAYETLYENACAPNIRHLEWKPEIKAALKLAAAAKED